MERIVPIVTELTVVEPRAVEVPVLVPGTNVVVVLKKGTSSPTLIIAVWLFNVRILGLEITSTLPCCDKAFTAAAVLKLVNTSEERLLFGNVESAEPIIGKWFKPPTVE